MNECCALIKVVKLLRTDTTLDLSQEARVVKNQPIVRCTELIWSAPARTGLLKKGLMPWFVFALVSWDKFDRFAVLSDGYLTDVFISNKLFGLCTNTSHLGLARWAGYTSRSFANGRVGCGLWFLE